MKKLIAVALMASLLGMGLPAQSATVKAGATCKSAGATATVKASPGKNKSQVFTCVKQKGKLVYGPARDVYKIKSLLNVSQVWTGNSVKLSITDSLGNDCAANSRTVGSECYGFYLGWDANFKDEERTVDYSKIETTTISGLQIGDRGVFQLKYQDPADTASPITIVKEFPFSYGY